MREIVSNYKFIRRKRQPYNLKRLLTKAKFTPNDTCEVKNVHNQGAAFAFIF